MSERKRTTLEQHKLDLPKYLDNYERLDNEYTEQIREFNKLVKDGPADLTVQQEWTKRLMVLKDDRDLAERMAKDLEREIEKLGNEDVGEKLKILEDVERQQREREHAERMERLHQGLHGNKKTIKNDNGNGQ